MTHNAYEMEEAAALISAVIVAYDSAACIGACLRSVLAALPEAQIVVVDNGSRDDTISIVRITAPQAQIIESGENVGFGRACNAGARAARGTHVLLLNPDVVVDAVDTPRLHELLDELPFGLAAPVLIGEGDRGQPETSWPAELFAHTVETLRPREWHRSSRRFRGVEPAWVSGGMLLARRTEFIDLGGFDPRYFLYYEDRDLSRRYRQAGLPIRTTPAIRGTHTPGTSSASDGLRTEPMAWSLLGWLEYLCIHEGEKTAARAAHLTLPTLRALRAVMHLLGALHVPRTTRKARQLDALLQALTAHAFGDDQRFCPGALRLVRMLLRSAQTSRVPSS